MKPFLIPILQLKSAFILLLALVGGRTYAQKTTAQTDTTARNIDSTRVTFCYANNHTEQPNDTFTLDTHRFNPLSRQAVPYTFLGNIGAPYTQLMYAPRLHSGIDLGFHQYDLYQPGLDDIRFYDAPRSFSEAFYTQAGTQEQGTLFTKLARSFGKQWSASFRYDIFTQKGIYQWQRPRHTHVSLALRYKSKNGRYQAFLSGIDNTAKMQQSGGYDLVQLGTAATGVQRGAIPSFNTAVDTQQRKQFQIAQFFKLAKGFEAAHTLRYGYDRFVFTDRAPKTYSNTYPINPDSTFYRFAYDSLAGANLFMENKHLTNTFQLQSPTDSLKKLAWSAGIRHAVWWTYQEPYDSTYQNLFALGSAQWQPLKALNIAADGAFGLAFRNAADYHIRAKAQLDLGKIGQLEGFLLSQRYAPTLLQTRMLVNYKQAWQNDFLPTYENTLGAKYSLDLPNVRLSGGFENHLLVNYIFNNTQQRPEQATNALNITQIKATANLYYKHFHLDNQFILQQMNTEAYLGMPNYWSRHSLYWQGKLFKNKLNLRGGIDATFISAYYAQGYNPLSGEFYVQNTQKLSFYPLIDAHINFVIAKFNGFVLYENMYNVATGSTYLSAPNYPMRDGNFRFGILWRFLD